MGIDATRFPNLASIESKQFRLGLKGYNVAQVDEFLAALVTELAVLQSALEAAEADVARLKREQDGY
jgi:DivIVA domain-containing protein